MPLNIVTYNKMMFKSLKNLFGWALLVKSLRLNILKNFHIGPYNCHDEMEAVGFNCKLFIQAIQINWQKGRHGKVYGRDGNAFKPKAEQ